MGDNFMNAFFKSKLFGIIIAVTAALLVCAVIITAITVKKPLEEEGSAGSSFASSQISKPESVSSATDAPSEPADVLDPEPTEELRGQGAEVEPDFTDTAAELSNGIDVSKWQGRIDWRAVASSGVEFAFIRIGYRAENGVIYKDSNADYNIQQAQKNNILVGVYFFSCAISEAEAVEEAEWTLGAVKGYSISYPIVYDCEGFNSPDSRMHGISAQSRTAFALKFLDKIAASGYDTMLYGAASELADSNCWIISSVALHHKIWVAHYPAVTYPQKPRPDYSGVYHAWQYTNKGRVSGVSGDTDLVVCYFKKTLTAPKDESVTPNDAEAPPKKEDMIYTSVSETVTAKDVTNLRESASTDSNIIGVLKNGETLKRTATGTNGWSKLEYNGKTVFAVSSFLTTDLTYKPAVQDIVSGNTFTAASGEVTAKEEVNLRALPTTDSEIIGVLKNGEFLERTAISDKGWTRLVFGGQTVYAVTSLLTE